MLNQISWKSYFEFAGIILLIYYSCIFFLFYKSNIRNWLSPKFQTTVSFSDNTSKILENESVLEGSESINYLIDETRALILQAGYGRSPKEELFFTLKKLISSERFEHIDKSLFKDQFNSLIKNECQINCSIDLSEEDLRVLWL